MTHTKPPTPPSAAASDYANPGPARVTAPVRSTPQNEAMMINGPRIANPEESPPSFSSVGAIPQSVLQLSDMRLKSALIAYLATAARAKDIAREHGFTGGVLSYWARKLGLPLRRRGR